MWLIYSRDSNSEFWNPAIEATDIQDARQKALQYMKEEHAGCYRIVNAEDGLYEHSEIGGNHPDSIECGRTELFVR